MTSEVCLVCSVAERTSYHFGSITCMACASFFRRTVSFGIRFLCKGNKTCNISPEVKFFCRACRFERCLKAGMKRDQVQQKKHEQKFPKYLLESRKHGLQEVVRGYTTTRISLDSVSPTNSTRSNSPAESSHASVSSSGFCTILNIRHDELLHYYVNQMKKAEVQRRGVLPEDPYQRFLISKKVNDQLALEICQGCPGTDLLDKRDLNVLFQYCSFASLWMDSAWLITNGKNSEIGDGDKNMTEKSVYSEYDRTIGNGEIRETSFAETVLIKFIVQLDSKITSELSRLQLDIFEYGALKCFCIWKLAILDSTLTLKILAQEQYTGVTAALSRYYQLEKGMDPAEMAPRLADITLFLSTIFDVYRDMLKMYTQLAVSFSSIDN